MLRLFLSLSLNKERQRFFPLYLLLAGLDRLRGSSWAWPATADVRGGLGACLAVAQKPKFDVIKVITHSRLSLLIVQPTYDDKVRPYNL